MEIVSKEMGLDPSEVNDDTNTSAHTDNLVMKYEEEFDVIIPEDDQNFQTIGEAVTCIDSLMNG